MADNNIHRELGEQSSAIKSMADDISEIKEIMKLHATQIGDHKSFQDRFIGVCIGVSTGVSILVSMISIGAIKIAKAAASIIIQ